MNTVNHSKPADLSVVLLHDQMLDKQGATVTTSITMLDIHDIARSASTYRASAFYVAHPSSSMLKLARALKDHWEHGYGATYNPNRKEALDIVTLASDLDEVIHKIDLRAGKLPRLIATSARQGPGRISFAELRTEIEHEDMPYLLMLGTGWGMTDALLSRANVFLEPIEGPSEYNHLSVRSACAIILDRLLAPQLGPK